MDYVFRVLDIPWWYYAVALLITVAIGRLWRWESGFLVGYAFLLLAETVLIRKTFTEEHLRMELFWSWKQWIVQREQILTNVVMFIPVGLLAGKLWRWKGLWFVAGLNIAIEVLQLVTARGLMEFDDFMHNMIGAAIDIGFMLLYMKKRGGA